MLTDHEVCLINIYMLPFTWKYSQNILSFSFAPIPTFIHSTEAKAERADRFSSWKAAHLLLLTFSMALIHYPPVIINVPCLSYTNTICHLKPYLPHVNALMTLSYKQRYLSRGVY